MHDLRGLLERATTDAPPPEAGSAEVFGRARSIQRRRRLGAGLAGAGTLGVLVAVAATLSGPAAVPDPAGGVAPATAAPPTTAPTAPTVLETLRDLLPPGARAGQEEETSGGFAGLVVTDPAGRTAVQVNVQPGFTHSGKTTVSQLLDRYDCAKRTDPHGTDCTATTSRTGTRILSIDGPADEGGPAEIVRRQVDVLGPDGLRVVVTAWNAVDVKNGPVTRSAPALTGRQLQQIATSTRWSSANAAPPASPGGAPS
ncbi:hypothetical protein [Actinoplanes sp. NPDC026623]|uniref:hypothetical protein n=1 Tax=Actinoplanes sp. NPDC026623 TaxID=3155610 RepID=UPI0033D1D256